MKEEFIVEVSGKGVENIKVVFDIEIAVIFKRIFFNLEIS